MDNSHPDELSQDEIHEMEERRVTLLNEGGIDERSVLDRARKHSDIWQSYFSENINIGNQDMDFVLRDQWDTNERNAFISRFKVCWTANKLLDPVNKIVGEQRKNKPDLIVRSLTGKASQEQIDLRSDLVRTIAYHSQNDLIYQTAFRQALLRGWGSIQIGIEYENPLSFHKVIRYLLIPDATLTSFDPTAVKPHKGDGDYCSRQYIFTQDQFNANYPYISNPLSYTDPRTLLNFDWETKDTIVVCDYYEKDWYPLKIYKLSNGETVKESQWEEMQKKEIKMKKELAASAQTTEARQIILSTIPEVVSERQTQDYNIMHYRLIKDRIIEFTKWPSKYLPIIFVDGNSDFIKGRQYTKSYVHEARDSQKFHNFLLSERATEIKNRRREQWLGTPENIIGQEQQWRNPEVELGMLIAQRDKAGQLPTKMPAWQLSPELLQESQSTDQEIREILGYSESQELQGRDVSGKARRERKIEGAMSAYIYRSNLDQAIEQTGRVVLDLLPYIIGEDERHMILSKKDGKSESIVLNKKLPDGSIENEIESGEYDIEIDTGPSFAVQKEIALEFLQQTIAMAPEQMLPLVADLWAKNLDVQFMPQMSERLKNLVPPAILAKEEGKELPPQPPSPQEQAMQMEIQIKQAELKEKEDELKLRADQHQLDRERYQLEKLKMMLEVKKANAEINMNMHDKKIDMHKSDLDYTAKMAKIMADLHNK